MRDTATRAPYAEDVPRKPMKNRVIRVDDDTWDAAMRAAEARDERLSEAIRNWLERYGRDHRGPKR